MDSDSRVHCARSRAHGPGQIEVPEVTLAVLYSASARRAILVRVHRSHARVAQSPLHRNAIHVPSTAPLRLETCATCRPSSTNILLTYVNIFARFAYLSHGSFLDETGLLDFDALLRAHPRTESQRPVLPEIPRYHQNRAGCRK